MVPKINLFKKKCVIRREYCKFILKYNIYLPSTFKHAHDNSPKHTFISATDTLHRIDYIGIPQNSFVSPTMSGRANYFDDAANLKDHRPTYCNFCLHLMGQCITVRFGRSSFTLMHVMKGQEFSAVASGVMLIGKLMFPRQKAFISIIKKFWPLL